MHRPLTLALVACLMTSVVTASAQVRDAAPEATERFEAASIKQNKGRWTTSDRFDMVATMEPSPPGSDQPLRQARVLRALLPIA